MEHVEECPVLAAAREAVAALLAYDSPYGPLIRTAAALAAIDALKEDNQLRACEEWVREDERSNNFTPDDFSEAMTEAYQRGLNDAREAVELIPAPYKVVGNFETYGPYHEGRSDMKDMVLSAIDALRKEPND